MSSKTITIIKWVLAGLVAFVFVGSSFGKFTASAESIAMGAQFGLDASAFQTLGTVELISALLFLYPRTGVLGTLLLTAYMGGAIATHLTHGISVVAPCVILAFVWIVAVFRFPELRGRILGSQG